jgi:hypothetical protein
MNNYTISDDFFLIENSDRKPIKLYYTQLKSIKINYYLTFFQKNFNFFSKTKKKSYVLKITMSNYENLIFKITESEKSFLKPKLELIKKNIIKHKKETFQYAE